MKNIADVALVHKAADAGLARTETDDPTALDVDDRRRVAGPVVPGELEAWARRRAAMLADYTARVTAAAMIVEHEPKRRTGPRFISSVRMPRIRRAA